MLNKTTVLALPFWAVCISIVFLWMSFSAYKAAQGVGESSVEWGNPFTTSADSEESGLRAQENEMLERLEYMVFPKERIEAQGILEGNLKKQINISPFDGMLWRNLAFSHEGRNITAEEQTWVFSRSLKLLKWHHSRRADLLNRCVVNYDIYKKVDTNLCRDLFRHIPMKNNLSMLRSRMRLEIKDLEAIMAKEGVSLGTGISRP